MKRSVKSSSRLMSFWCTDLGKPLSIYQISDLAYEQMKTMAMISKKPQPDVHDMMGVFNFGQGRMELHVYPDPATMECKEKLGLRLGLFSREKITEAALVPSPTTIAYCGTRFLASRAQYERVSETRFLFKRWSSRYLEYNMLLTT